MAKDCCWNCKYYIARGDNEPYVLSSSTSNVCTYRSEEDKDKNWEEAASPTPAGYVCRFYAERFY